jgi:alginate O-acetyltransferase complex protein AlgJ
LAGFVIPENAQEILKEGRTPAPVPSVPHSLDRLAALPNELDDYLHEHFGLRTELIGWYAYLANWMLAEGNQQVLVGRHGRMFYLGDDAVRQSAGLVRRESRVAETADFLAAVRDALMERGIRFLVASPPNAATIYQDDLPRWARSNGRTTEYDLFIKDLPARGIRAIDLRPIIWTVRSKAPAYFLYDTHWTPRAAIAGFNAVSEADGHRGWRIDADAALARSSQRKGGDLARMIGVSNDVAEPHQEMALPSVSKVELTTGQFPSYVATRDKPGETVMIIGDSFTVYYFAPMLLNHVGRVVWQHHKWCGFDWKLIDRFRPDEVWWMPTERYLLCIPPNARPDGFPSRTGHDARSLSSGGRRVAPAL